MTSAPPGWRRFRPGAVDRRVLAAAVTVGLATCAVKVAATGKEVLVAHRFGTSDALDAFFVALLLPFFAINLIGGSWSAALLPVHVRVMEHEGPAAAQRLFSSVMAASLGLLVATGLALALVFPLLAPLLASGFGPEKLALTRTLFYLLLPIIVLSGLASTLSAVLNARNRFATGALAPMLTPLATILLLLAVPGRWNVHALVGGMVGGAAMELVVLALALRREGLSPVPRWHGMSPAVSGVMAQFAPMVGGSLLMGGTVIVDQSMAAMLGGGSVSVLNYANRIVALITTVGATAIGTAVLPHFSRLAALGDFAGIRRSLRQQAILILAVSLPVTLGLVLLSRPLVRLLFERGAFEASDTMLVGRVQALLALQIPSYLLGMLLVRLTTALRHNRLLLIVSAVNLVVNVVLNYVLMRHLGVAGIALSTSLVYLLSTILVFTGLMRLEGVLRPTKEERRG